MFICNRVSITLKNGNQLVENLNLVLNDGDKLALIGEEGNGKTTLLKCFYDPLLVEPYALYQGQQNLVSDEIAYLPQALEDEWLEKTTLDFLLQKELDSEKDFDIYHHFFDVEKLFHTFDLDLDLLEHPRLIKTLSGGEKIKLQLVKLFMTKAKLFLLDEPTNDIDIETIAIFESVIKQINTPIIFISHDEMLLSHVANQILHLEQIKRQKLAKFNYEKIGYQDYISMRKRQISQHNRDAYRTQKDYEKRRQTLMHQHLLVENDLDRANGNQPSLGRLLAKKMRNVKSQEKKLSEMEVLDYYREEEAMNLFFDDSVSLPNGKVILDLTLDRLVAGDKELAKNIELKIVGPEHIAIIGINGSGKTTLIRQILNDLKTKVGIHVGYMPQDYHELLDPSMSAVEYLQSKLGYETTLKSQIMTFLGALNFIESEMTSPISTLSSGLKAKLYLLELVMAKNDVIVLDEPTRNLSPLSNPVVRIILNKFKGAIIMVTHDRTLIHEVASTTYTLTKDGLSKTII